MTRQSFQSILPFAGRREKERAISIFVDEKAWKRYYAMVFGMGPIEIIQFRIGTPAHLMFHQLKRRYNGANCKTWAGLLSGIVGMGGRHSCDNHPPCPALFITSLKFKR